MQSRGLHHLDLVVSDPGRSSAPKELPHHAPGYYAAFFFDPDGIKLEVVYEPTRAATTSD